jgi:hypothetical protein
MTTRTSSRLAGFMFLFYIANGVTHLVLSGRVTAGAATKLAGIAQHATLARWTSVLALMEGVDAIVLGLALYAITRMYDHDLALLALLFRVGEGVLGATAALRYLGLIALARNVADGTVNAVAANAVAAAQGPGMVVGATLFAIGSTIFAWLFLRARTIPMWLAWLGVVSSVLLVIVLPLEMAGVLGSPITDVVWIPIAVYEIVFAIWLIVKGVPDVQRA